jgi:hypothetical protein
MKCFPRRGLLDFVLYIKYIFFEKIYSEKKRFCFSMGKVDVAVEVSGAVPCESARVEGEYRAEC